MTTALVTVLVLTFLVYLGMLTAWWPVLDDPDHFTREDTHMRETAAWARQLVVGHRPIRSYVDD